MPFPSQVSSAVAGARWGGSPGPARAAFTLIELLVVMGLIGIFAGVIGLALKKGPTIQGVTGSQNIIVGMLNLARIQAAITQGNGRTTEPSPHAARLIIYAAKGNDTDDALYLRRLQVVVPAPAPGNPNTEWISKGEPFDLPQGVYVLPPTAPGTGQVVAGVSWNLPNCKSTVSSEAMIVDGQPSRLYYHILFRVIGTSDGGIIALTEGQAKVPGSTTSQNEPVLFSNPLNIRGLRISQYGAVTLLNDAKDF